MTAWLDTKSCRCLSKPQVRWCGPAVCQELRVSAGRPGRFWKDRFLRWPIATVLSHWLTNWQCRLHTSANLAFWLASDSSWKEVKFPDVCFAENSLRCETNDKEIVCVCHSIFSTNKLSSGQNNGRVSSQIASAARKDACSQRWVSSNVGAVDSDGFMISTVQLQFHSLFIADTILDGTRSVGIKA